MIVLPLQIPRMSHTDARRDRGRTVPGIKYVARTLRSLRKTTHPTKRTQVSKAIPAAGQKFMCIRLVTDIPDHLILRKVKHEMDRHSQFDGTQIRRKMTARAAHAFDQEIPYLPG